MSCFDRALLRGLALLVAVVPLVTGCGARPTSSGALPAPAGASDFAKQALADGFRPLTSRSRGHGKSRGHHHRKFTDLVPGKPPEKIDPRHIPAGLQRRISEIKVAPSTADRQFAALRRTSAGGAGARNAQNVMYDVNAGGQFGLYSYQGSFFKGGTFGFQTGYETVETAFALPINDWLYAPTSRGVGGACLEIGSSYSWLGAKVYAYDFCDSTASDGIGVFHYLFNIDGGFRNTYERDYGDGLPSYLYETYYDWGTGKWAFLIYNASSGAWEVRYESKTGTLNPLAQGANGWNMFETHYFTDEGINRSGACPLALEAHSWNLEWLNPAGGWQYLDTVPGMSYAYRTYDQYNQCLDEDDGSERGFYYLLDGVTGHEWYADAFPSEAPPTCDQDCGYPYYPPYYYYYYPCFGGQHISQPGDPCALSKRRSARTSGPNRRTTGAAARSPSVSSSGSS